MNLNNMIKQNSEVPTTELDGEIGFLSVEEGMYFAANSIGNIIWNSIKEPISVSDLVAKLMVEYEVEQQQCEEDVLEFLTDMEAKNLIIVQ